MTTEIEHQEEIGRADHGKVQIRLDRISYLSPDLTTITHHRTRQLVLTVRDGVHRDAGQVTVGLDHDAANEVIAVLQQGLEHWTEPVEMDGGGDQ